MKEKAIGKGLSIAFLGPDGSGKSTLISGLTAQDLPFASTSYFHLKPVLKPKGHTDTPVKDPHQYEPYSVLKSYGKLMYFIFQYNWGWFRNIRPLKKKNSLVIFDRYYDDMMADPKRYRYGGYEAALRWVRRLIPRPDLYFVLTAEAEIIYGRKQEVPLAELKRQIKAYRALVDDKKYLSINIARTPEEIVAEITKVITERHHEHD